MRIKAADTDKESLFDSFQRVNKSLYTPLRFCFTFWAFWLLYIVYKIKTRKILRLTLAVF